MAEQPIASQQYQAYQTLNDGTGKPDKRMRFPANEDSDCQDGVWACAFIVHLLAVLGVIGWRFATTFGKLKHPEQEVESELTTGYLPGALLALAFGILVAIIWTVSIRSCAYAMLMMTIVVNGLLWVAAIGCCVLVKNFIGAGVCGFFLALFLLWLYCIWDRIPFTAQLISTATEIMVQAPGTLCATFNFLIVSIVFSLVTLAGLTCLKYEVEHQSQSEKQQNKGMFYGLLIGLMFSTYWTSAVISNVLHMTICGVVGRWYFKAKDWASATSASLGRALGKSFGSVCFGSFIIAILKTIRFIIDMARDQAEGGPGAVMLVVLDCIVGCIESLVQFFNTYAYVYCAVYGLKFWDAGKRTWDLFTESGIDMIVAYDLSGSLTFLGALLGGGFSALFTFAAIHFTGDAMEMHGKGWLKPKDGELTPTYVIFAFVTGFIFVLVASTPIESGVTALLVCYAEEPDVLAENYPELHKKLEELNDQCRQEKALKQQEEAANQGNV